VTKEGNWLRGRAGSTAVVTFIVLRKKGKRQEEERAKLFLSYFGSR